MIIRGLLESGTPKILSALFAALLLSACTTEDNVPCAYQEGNANSCSGPVPAPDPAPVPDPDPLPDPDPYPIPDPAPGNTQPTTTPVSLGAIAEDSGARTITQSELLANASDVDGDALTATNLSIASGAGTLVSNGNGSWSYTPALNDNTSVNFSYGVSDGAVTVVGTATLDITPQNDPPTTSKVTLTAVTEDSNRTISQAELLANANDVDGDTLTATGLNITSGNGSLVSIGGGTWRYTPAQNDASTVGFSYNVTDGTSSVTATAVMDIQPVNDAPTTTPVTLNAINEDSGANNIYQSQLLANASDVDGDTLTATGLVIQSGKGSLVSLGGGTWRYTPALNDSTSVTFRYNVTDGALSVTGTASMDIRPGNDAPTTTQVTLSAIEENSGARLITQAQLLANASDIDGDTLTATGLIIASGSGNLSSNGGGTWSYTPAHNDSSAVSFSYSISDGSVSVTGTASMDITPAPASGSITLRWVAPVTREDETPIQLSEIAGYRIYYGTSPGVYPVQLNINDGSIVQTTLNDMAPGNYYIVITTIDMDGRESSFSEMVAKHL